MTTSTDAYIIKVIPLWLRLVKSLAIAIPTIVYAGIFVEIGIWPLAVLMLVLLIPAWRLFKKTESKTLNGIYIPNSKKDKYIALGIVLSLGVFFLIENTNNIDSFILTALLIIGLCSYIFLYKGRYILTIEAAHIAEAAKAVKERVAAEKHRLDSEKWWWKLLGFMFGSFMLFGVLLMMLFYASSLLTILNNAQAEYLVASGVNISKHEFLSEMCQEKSTCKQYAEVSFDCAVAGNFDQCLKIRMGEEKSYKYRYCAKDGSVIGLTNEITPSTIQCLGNTLGHFNYLIDKKRK